MRHVQSDHNVGGWISADRETDEKSNITPEGLKQAERLGKELVKLNIHMIYHSPFKRVCETCRLVNVYLNVPAFADNRLRQLDCGIFNGRTWKERDGFFKNDMEKFVKRPPGGENLNDLKERMLAAWRDIDSKHQNHSILIISHGNPLRMLQAGVLGLSDEESLCDQRCLKWKSNVSPEPEVGELLLA